MDVQAAMHLLADASSLAEQVAQERDAKAASTAQLEAQLRVLTGGMREEGSASCL